MNGHCGNFSHSEDSLLAIPQQFLLVCSTIRAQIPAGMALRKSMNATKSSPRSVTRYNKELGYVKMLFQLKRFVVSKDIKMIINGENERQTLYKYFKVQNSLRKTVHQDNRIPVPIYVYKPPRFKDLETTEF